MTKTKLAPAPVKVLWMDDKPDSIENYRDILANENKIEIQIATSINEAQQRIKDPNGSLNKEIYEAFIVDCQMDPFDLSVNGAKFLKEVNEIDKAFPTFVYSAWSKDPRYTKYLDQSYAILIEARGGFEHPLMENPFFRKVYEVSQRYREVKRLEPEKIPFHDYLNAPERYTQEVGAHWKKHGHWISKDLSRANWRWGVACGEEVVAGSNDLFDYPGEKKLIEIGLAHNLIPFAYSVPILPEDTPIRPTTGAIGWNATANRNDYYPAIRVRIGSIELREDFDTGAEQTIVAEDLVKMGILSFLREYSADFHLGDRYEFLTQQVEISLVDSSGNALTRELPVAVVKDWVKSPFTKVNRKRKVLLGRDLLRAFQVEVCLDSHNRVTRVRFLEDESLLL
jgi:hypothetical protein